MIKAVIFDCFGVLAQPARTLLYRDYPQFNNEIDDLEHQNHLGMIDRNEFENAIAKLVGLTPEQVKSRYYDISVKDKSAVALVRQVKKMNRYKVGLLSNVGPDRIGDVLPMTDLRELFDEVTLSFQVGMVKPEVAIFDLMAQRMGVATNECIMIDDRESNLEGAQNAGMQTIRFISSDQVAGELLSMLERGGA
ncbi:HAD family phosphatase [Candidatus Saccharibacteria bacterium]|nr:HAD family phosphatase [Candidatus Saccharibacteria bacterium]